MRFGMATVSELCAMFGQIRGLNESEVKQVARALQQSNLLPLANRRQRMRPPEITIKHCVVFLIGLACSSPSGSRTPATLGPRVRKFLKLAHLDAGGSPVKLQDEIARIIDLHRDNEWLNGRGRYLRRILFVIDDKDPQVDIEWGRFARKGEPIFERHNYCDARQLSPDVPIKYDHEFGGLNHAYILGSDAFLAIRNVLGPLEEAEARQRGD